MTNDYFVRIIYRNESLDPIYEKTYSLRDYTEMLRSDQLKLITDVEDMAYMLNGNKGKEDWSDETWAQFCRIKHKLLDKAGDIGRLPENMRGHKGERDSNGSSLSDFVANVFNKGTS